MALRAGAVIRLGAATALLLAPVFLAAYAHCPSTPPKVEMQFPAAGTAVQNACYADFGTCFTDTFYQEKLLQELGARYQAARYAALAYVDSISNYLTYDTTWYRGQPYYVDTFQTEKVWISIQANLKDSLPVSRLSYTDRWVAFTGNPFATTYTPLVDTPFVALFSEYDSIRQLGVGPMDGCFFEATAYTIINGRIHKKGLVGERMPGVSVPWEDFFRIVGHAPVTAPLVREAHVGLLRRSLRPTLPWEPSWGQAYDALGRTRHRITPRGSKPYRIPIFAPGPAE